MKFFFDLFPVILFFLAFKIWGIYVATTVAIAGTVAQVAWLKLRGRKVETTLWISLVIIVIFGGATLFLQDESFIKWKPTVLYWLFSVSLVVAELFFGRNLIKAMMQAQVALPEPLWRKLNWSWAGFFAVMGMLNLYVADNYPTDIWVDFKLFGTTGLMILFVIGQGVVLARHVDPGDRKSTRLNSSHVKRSRMPSSA